MKKLFLLLAVGFGLGTAFFILMSIAGCILSHQPAGVTRCVGGYAIQISDGKYWVDSGTDCTTTVPPTVCVQPAVGAAYCKAVQP
jgi:hypothetical protein